MKLFGGRKKRTGAPTTSKLKHRTNAMLYDPDDRDAKMKEWDRRSERTHSISIFRPHFVEFNFYPFFSPEKELFPRTTEGTTTYPTTDMFIIYYTDPRRPETQ